MPAPLYLLSSPAPNEGGPLDDYLMALAAEGQETAFAQLIQRHERKLRGFCALLLKDESAARDAAQDVFLRIWEERSRYRPEGKFKQMLFTVARNRCRSLLRHRRLLGLLGFEPLTQQPGPSMQAASPAEHSLVEEKLSLVRGALQRLPEKFRVPLILRFVEEMPYEQIAEVIDRTPSAARSRVHYGLQQLEALLPPEVYE